MSERRYYYNGMYAAFACIGFVGAYLIFLGTGVVMPMIFLLLAIAAAWFSVLSFAKRRRLLEDD